MENQEQFNPNRYIEMFRQHYAKQVGNLVEQIERRLESSTNPGDAFRILESVDRMVAEVPNARILERYSSQGRNSASENEGPFSVEYSQDYKNVGDALRDFRHQAGLTISELSRLSGVSIRSIVDTEANKTTPRKQNLVKFLTCFDVQPTKALKDFWQLWNRQKKTN